MAVIVNIEFSRPSERRRGKKIDMHVSNTQLPRDILLGQNEIIGHI